MIKIQKPWIEKIEGLARLCANVEMGDGIRRMLWFEVPVRYEKYLCAERSDAFVMAFVQYALQYGQEEIISEGPLTDVFYDGVTTEFLPAFNKINGTHLRIVAPVAPEVEHPDDGCHVGTGCSCGVDSMHVYAMHTDITDGCVWNGHGVDFLASKEDREGLFGALVERARSFTSSEGINLVVGNSNFDTGCIDGLRWEGMTTYGNLFNILAMQKYWKKYYVASDCDVRNFSFRMKGVFADPARYEYFLFPFLRYKNLSIVMDGADRNRVEKVADLKDYAPARKYLNVCHRLNANHRNGTNDCAKCMRTLLDLDACGIVDEFSAVFDVAYYHRYFHEYLAELYRGCLQKNSFALELKPYFCSRSIPMSIRIKAWRIVFRKAIKKILRSGRTRVGRFSSKG